MQVDPKIIPPLALASRLSCICHFDAKRRNLVFVRSSRCKISRSARDDNYGRLVDYDPTASRERVRNEYCIRSAQDKKTPSPIPAPALSFVEGGEGEGDGGS